MATILCGELENAKCLFHIYYNNKERMKKYIIKPTHVKQPDKQTSKEKKTSLLAQPTICQ